MKTYTIEQIREALKRCQLGEPTRPVLPDEVVAELTRPKFSEGQVMHHTNTDGYTDYCVWGKQVIDSRLVRPLNQAEVGNDWVPREAAMKLRDATNKYLPYVPGEVRDALAEFDEVVK